MQYCAYRVMLDKVDGSVLNYNCANKKVVELVSG